MQNSIIEELSVIENKEKENLDRISNLNAKLNNISWFSFDLERIERLAVMVQRGKTANYGTSSTQIIKSGQARGYNEFDFSKRYYVSANFMSDERNLQKGDILINSTGVGTAGRVTLFDLDGNYVVDSHITIVRLDREKALPKYVLYALANIGFKNIEAMATGQSGQIELALPTINAMRIPLPPLDVQKEIVGQIELIEQEIQYIKEEIFSAKVQKQEVLNNYLN
ncbi:MAG: restriction endonuclease subunit S [Lachnospiraceae bacterium]|nr:restriction endonuclease subunit S [Lachnospiraceae bacterium]